TEMLKEGKVPKQVTMGWNEKEGATVQQRSKEEANDYRYFPDPDLPALQFTKEYLDDLRGRLPELPAAKRSRFKAEYNLDDASIENLINWKELTYYFEEVVSEMDEWKKSDADAGATLSWPYDRQVFIKQIANWCLGEFSAAL